MKCNMNFLDKHCSPITAVLVCVIVIVMLFIILKPNFNSCNSNNCQIENNKL
jgi:hypothetical protein